MDVVTIEDNGGEQVPKIVDLCKLKNLTNHSKPRSEMNKTQTQFSTHM